MLTIRQADMEAQICKLLMEFCSRRLEAEYNKLNTSVVNGVEIRIVDETKPEPWMTFSGYTNEYHTTLRQAVLVLRRLYAIW